MASGNRLRKPIARAALLAYPRRLADSGDDMRISLSAAWDETKAIVARDGKLILAVTLALVVLPQIIAGLFDPQMGATGEQSRSAILFGILAILVGIVGQLALVRLALGPPVSVGEAIVHGARRFFPAFAALILFGVGLALVLIPLVMLLAVTGLVEAPQPGARPSGDMAALVFVMVIAVLVIVPRVLLLIPVASAESGGPIQLLRRSWSISRGNYWRLLAFFILIFVAAIVMLLAAQLVGGVLAGIAGKVEPMSLSALIVALFVSVAQGAFTILSSVMLARMYRQAAGGGASAAAVPKSGT